MSIDPTIVASVIGAISSVAAAIIGVRWGKMVQPRQSGIVVTSSPGSPDIRKILNAASHSLLLVGTSNFRVVHDEFSEVRSWLDANPNRIFGILFLAPYSPHAHRRERRDIHRSSQQSIIDSIRTSDQEAKEHRRFIPAIYDGPYRYSANGVDLGDAYSSKDSRISLFTSSHQGGISKGFRILLTPLDSPKEFRAYREELLDLWRSAVANPHGHGISLAFRREIGLSDDTFSDWSLLLKGRLRSIASIHWFSSEQLHLTVTSLCRSQSEHYHGPLRISGSENPLPENFGNLLSFVIDEAKEISRQEFEFVFDSLKIDELGYISLTCDSSKNIEFCAIINKLINNISHKILELSCESSDSRWLASVSHKSTGRYGPKYSSYIPNLTVGVAFTSQTALPTRLENKSEAIQLPEKVIMRPHGLSLVHYAYRTFLRTVGEVEIQPYGNKIFSNEEILFRLGIKW